jgi:hypothetical protein
MADLTSFARDTERFVVVPAFDRVLRRRRRGRVRRAAIAAAAAMVALLGIALSVAGLGQRTAGSGPPSPAPRLTSVAVPDWSAEQVVGHPDAFVIAQVESRTDRRTVLTSWKRCTVASPDHDCLGREAMAVVDGAGHRLLVLGAVSGPSTQPKTRNPGLLREVDDAVWYWAHQDPGPYLLSASMRHPVQLTVMDHPVRPRYGVPAIECADREGLCTLDVDANTLERLAVPDLPGMRWAIPNATGCGLWGTAGAGSDLRLVIQQRDGSFAMADIPDDSVPMSPAEGGNNCEVAYYQTVSASVAQMVVSLDEGTTWQVRRARSPQLDGAIENEPRLRVLLPPRWAAMPTTKSVYGLPGELEPL